MEKEAKESEESTSSEKNTSTILKKQEREKLKRSLPAIATI